jgi:hypothetical protein
MTESVPTLENRNLSGLQQFLRYSFVPEFLGQKHHLKSARVTKFIRPGDYHLLGWYLEVEFDSHQDCQTVYPSWWKKRVAYVRVSKRLFDAKPHSVDVFCQYSRHNNQKNSVRVRIAH